ncbi:MAG: hypothetical protein ACLTZN_07975 [Streptococcus sp.]
MSFTAVQGVKAEEVSTPSSSVQVEAADSSLLPVIKLLKHLPPL